MQQFTHVDTQYYPQQNYQTLHKQRYEAYQQLQALAKNCRE
ncbi:ribitol kinase domain protein [Escherichia coli DEC2B]|nr:ribitol kinase domain protein [Escherichia coli DEC2B]